MPSLSLEQRLEWGKEWEDVVYDQAADEAADAAPDFSAQRRTAQLIQHCDRVQTQLESSNRRWQCRLDVWLLSGCSDLVHLCEGSRDDSQVKVDQNGLLLLEVIWLVGCHIEGAVQLSVPFFLDENQRLFLTWLANTRFEWFIVVFLLQVDGAIGNFGVSHQFCDVKAPFADHVVRGNYITIPSLHCQDKWFDCWCLQVEEETVVEAGRTLLFAIVSIRLLSIILADEALNEYVAHALCIHGWDVFALKDSQPYLKFVLGLLANVPNLSNIAWLSGRVYVEPHVDDALVELAARVVQLSCLDWLFIDCLPFGVEESVVEVDGGLADQIIAEQQIIVVSLNDKRWCPREAHIEVVAAHELGVGFIVLIFLFFAFCLISTSDYEEWITGRTNVSWRKLVALDQVQVNNSFGLSA